MKLIEKNKMEKINSKDILLQELQENTHIERVEDVIFWALEAYAKKENPSNGSMVAYAIVQRIKDGEIYKQITEAKTMCCKAKWYRKSRANFRCENCEKDVTLEIMLLYEAKNIKN